MGNDKKSISVAIVHDFLDQLGGAERVLEAISEIYPDAPIFTLLYDEEKIRGKFKGKRIHTSFLQRFPRFLRKRKKWLLPLLPIAPETFNLRDYDLVISSSGAWAKGIVTRLNTVHVSYMHSPMRFAWDVKGEYLEQQKKSSFVSFLARVVMNYIRVWDKAAADRPDFLVANSEYTQERIKKYYKRDSVVIYPPVDIDLQKNEPNEKKTGSNDGYFVVVSRLSPYKKIDMAVEAFNKLELPLVIVGTGEQENYLRSIAKENIRFLGWRKDEELVNIYRGARAFIFPGVDDFGIAPVEALSHGLPVLAIRHGGIKEVIVEGEMGEFFDASTPEVIADAVRRFIEKEKEYDKNYIRDKVSRFSKERFKKEFEEYIGRLIQTGLD